MQQNTSNRINRINESSTILMAQKARYMKENNIEVIDLSIGEPDFNVDEYIKISAKKAIDENFSHYSPIPGYKDLRLSIVDKFKRDNQLNYSIDNIIVSNGAKQSIFNLILSLINKDDEVIIPKPYWVSYSEIVKISNGKCVFIDTNIDTKFKININELENYITAKTKLFIFSSPSNPTGTIYKKHELEAIAKILNKYPNIFILSDEIYEYINYVGKHISIANIDNMYKKTFIINGCSKGYSMTGWRIGYMAGPKHIIKSCIKLQGHSTSGPCSISQKAAYTAISSYPNKDKIQDLMKRRDLVYNNLNKIKGLKLYKPDGAFYFFIDISSFYNKKYKNNIIKNSTDFTMLLLENEQVVLVGGKDFGNDNCIRLSYAVSNNKLIIAIQKIINFIKNIK
ncbi:MAG: pyridoxal phosphate-dependent aminotransferase [Bacteroides sp.]|nr:MAG: pyridoxal phosphate-dependent aminotransferase [Bacteroides sp.]